MIKKLTAIILVACMLMLAGCGQVGTNSGTAAAQNDTKGQTESQVLAEKAEEQNGDSEAQDADTEAEQNGGANEQNDDAASAQATGNVENAAGDDGAEPGAVGSDMLVVFFSRTGEQYGVGVIDKGNTAVVAEMIAGQTGADMFEVLPEDDYYPYTYDELTDVAKQEQNENARPAYAGEAPDLSQYSTIFIGAPVWWGDWPMVMYTFFEENAAGLAGKTLVPFSTHAGSGLSGFDSKLKDACPGSTITEGLAISGADAQNNQEKVRQNVSDWLSELGY